MEENNKIRREENTKLLLTYNIVNKEKFQVTEGRNYCAIDKVNMVTYKTGLKGGVWASGYFLKDTAILLLYTHILEFRLVGLYSFICHFFFYSVQCWNVVPLLPLATKEESARRYVEISPSIPHMGGFSFLFVGFQKRKETFWAERKLCRGIPLTFFFLLFDNGLRECRSAVICYHRNIIIPSLLSCNFGKTFWGLQVDYVRGEKMPSSQLMKGAAQAFRWFIFLF